MRANAGPRGATESVMMTHFKQKVVIDQSLPDTQARVSRWYGPVGTVSANASAWATWSGRRTWHARTLHVREPGGLRVGRRLLWLTVRGGKARSCSRRCTIWRSQTLP